MSKAKYEPLRIPPGDYADVFQRQSMEMSAVHNLLIRGLNSMLHYAPEVKPNDVQEFMFFCDVFTEMLHKHHEHEEIFYFPFLEEKLGKGSMETNVESHHAFMPHLETFLKYIKSIQNGQTTFNASEFDEKCRRFADPLVPHLHEEIATLDPERLRSAMTADELLANNKKLIAQVQKDSTPLGTLPLIFCLHNVKEAKWFPPFPGFLYVLSRYVFSWWHAKAFTYGPCTFDGKLKPGFK